ncbi:hypothetical protein PENTCL1PPCAC_4449 [Pristionchus entomophagus]|uniref:TEA domain-containing protein n=1 Tax=Pristionchus entomophagus TaxID=358040 RepID=A0AAV5SLP4_9BILA|nr:hypothetical protein PENTCL1PPCAC_4449 [Pristionchus entomophagus]
MHMAFPSSNPYPHYHPFFRRFPTSPIETKLWSSGHQIVTLSPPNGDQPTLLSSDPIQSCSNNSVKDEAMDQMPSGSGGSPDEVEGVWSQDIEQAFQEALRIYPPCGRRKIILSDEGKMYGRNELIARFIKIRTGKTRTRKQVSSHIQVLMRKIQRESGGGITKESGHKASSVSPASLHQIQQELKAVAASVSAASSDSLGSTPPTAAAAAAAPPPSQQQQPLQIKDDAVANAFHLTQQLAGKSLFPAGIYPTPFNFMLGDYKTQLPGYENRAPFMGLPTPPDTTIAVQKDEPMGGGGGAVTDGYQIESAKMRLCGFSAFVEVPGETRTDIIQIPALSEQPFTEVGIHHDILANKYPQLLFDMYDRGPKDAFFLVKCWANINYDVEDKRNAFFGVDSAYETTEDIDIMVNTTVCTFQKVAIEKEETYSPVQAANGKYLFDIKNSPFCDYMVSFISKLKLLESQQAMSKVLEHFTVYQVVSNKETKETLLVIAFIFDINDQSGCSIFRLVDSDE